MWNEQFVAQLPNLAKSLGANQRQSAKPSPSMSLTVERGVGGQAAIKLHVPETTDGNAREALSSTVRDYLKRWGADVSPGTGSIQVHATYASGE